MNKLNIKELREKLGITQEELAKRLGVHARTIQNWESGTKIPESKHAILRTLTKDEATAKTQPHDGEAAIIPEERNLVPLIPIQAQGGSLNDFTTSVMEYDCEKVLSPIKGVDYAMTVSGDSMAPEYPSGCQILIKRIDENAFIDWGKVFVLDTVNGAIIKKLMPTSDPDKVLCVSINPDYPSYEVCLEHVFGVYRVLMCMSMK